MPQKMLQIQPIPKTMRISCAHPIQKLMQKSPNLPVSTPRTSAQHNEAKLAITVPMPGSMQLIMRQKTAMHMGRLGTARFRLSNVPSLCS